MADLQRDVYGRIIYSDEDIQKTKGYCAIGYLPIFFLLPLFCCKDSPFARYHANQGLLFTIVCIVIGALSWLVSFTGPGIVLSWVLDVLLLILFLRQAIGAWKGGTPSLPLIGELTLLK